MAFLICLLIRFPLYTFNAEEIVKWAVMVSMYVTIRPATIVFVTHLNDQIVYHYHCLIKLTFLEG